MKPRREQLDDRHLIQWVDDIDGCCKIHPLMREFLKVKLAASELADDLKRGFAETFVRSLTSIFIDYIVNADNFEWDYQKESNF